MAASFLVLGGSSGIGLAVARRLLERGDAVTLAARDLARLERAGAELAAHHPGRLRHAEADGMDAGAVRRAVEVSCDARGRLAGAVAVPGGGDFCPVSELDGARLADDLARNTVPFQNLLRAALPAMPEGGSLVAVSSTAAAQSARGLAGYCAGKAALEGLVRVAADELGARGIRVNAVRPGFTRTGATEAMFASEAVQDAFRGQLPLGRTGEPGDVAGAVAFLLGPGASWITGQLLAADGGHLLRAFPAL